MKRVFIVILCVAALLGGCIRQQEIQGIYTPVVGDEIQDPNGRNTSAADCHEFPEKCKPTPKNRVPGSMCNPLTEACGPFPQAVRDLCYRKGGGSGCYEEDIWDKEFYEELMKELGTGSNIGQRLHAYYSVRSNYDAVKAAVAKFYKPVETNGCVAFASTALRKIGVNIPMGETSLVTKPFATYLRDKLKWQEFTDMTLLQKGDLIFTTDAPGYPGYPSHVFVFAGWADEKARISWAIDNQFSKGYPLHKRGLRTKGDSFDDFKFAIRPN